MVQFTPKAGEFTLPLGELSHSNASTPVIQTVGTFLNNTSKIEEFVALRIAATEAVLKDYPGTSNEVLPLCHCATLTLASAYVSCASSIWYVWLSIQSCPLGWKFVLYLEEMRNCQVPFKFQNSVKHSQRHNTYHCTCAVAQDSCDRRIEVRGMHSTSVKCMAIGSICHRMLRVLGVKGL